MSSQISIRGSVQAVHRCTWMVARVVQSMQRRLSLTTIHRRLGGELPTRYVEEVADACRNLHANVVKHTLRNKYRKSLKYLEQLSLQEAHTSLLENSRVQASASFICLLKVIRNWLSRRQRTRSSVFWSKPLWLKWKQKQELALAVLEDIQLSNSLVPLTVPHLVKP